MVLTQRVPGQSSTVDTLQSNNSCSSDWEKCVIAEADRGGGGGGRVSVNFASYNFITH